MMRKWSIAALMLALGTMAGCDDGGDDDGADMGAAMAEAPMAYNQICSSCHGPDGEGTSLGPDIRNPADWGYGAYVVRNGRGEMDEFASPMSAYSADIIDDVTLDEVWTWLGAAAKPADGAGLFARFCANCHDADGSGGRAEHAVGIDQAEIRASVREGNGGENYGASTEFMPAFGTDLITDAELDLIVEHIGTL